MLRYLLVHTLAVLVCAMPALAQPPAFSDSRTIPDTPAYRRAQEVAGLIKDQKPAKWRDYIQQDPKIMLGKPVIKGTRLTVELILERLGDGWPVEDLLASYPDLRPEHIRAAQAYAASYLALDRTIFDPVEAR